jgi:hypothetical protein
MQNLLTFGLLLNSASLYTFEVQALILIEAHLQKPFAYLVLRLYFCLDRNGKVWPSSDHGCLAYHRRNCTLGQRGCRAVGEEPHALLFLVQSGTNVIFKNM